MTVVDRNGRQRNSNLAAKNWITGLWILSRIFYEILSKTLHSTSFLESSWNEPAELSYTGSDSIVEKVVQVVQFETFFRISLQVLLDSTGEFVSRLHSTDRREFSRRGLHGKSSQIRFRFCKIFMGENQKNRIANANDIRRRIAFQQRVDGVRSKESGSFPKHNRKVFST